MTKTNYLGPGVHAATITIASLEGAQDKAEILGLANDPMATRKTMRRLEQGREPVARGGRGDPRGCRGATAAEAGRCGPDIGP